MIDIDYFKKVNDSFGHMQGDRILKELGQRLQKVGRQTDLIARFGGEEFIILLPNTDVNAASLFAAQLHKLVSTIQVNNTPITVSIGITISDGSQNLNHLSQQADEALYLAKNKGRNRTEIYS
jgi:diguanylate cyclase (GGDEF)-like protein